MINENRETVEKYAGQISSRLFGKQSAYTPIQAPVTIRPAGMIVKDLCQLNDIEWTKYAFSRDPLNGKFSDEEKEQLMQKALDCGRDAAIECISRYETNDPTELAKSMGIDVSYPSQPQDGGRVLFAEFCPPREINIFLDAIDRVSALMEKKRVKNALGEIRLKDILLGHELFHVVEDQQINTIWTKTHKIQLWRIGPIRNNSRIISLSEIAAMSFSKHLNNLPYMPYVLDAFLVYGYSSDMASRLYKEMMHYAGKEPRKPKPKE